MAGLNPNDGEFITLTEGGNYTQRFRDQFDDPSTIIKGHFLGKNKINDLLAQEGVIGLRTYYGINDNEEPCIVVVAVDQNGNDKTNLIIDKSKPCPPSCGSGNVLNGN